MCSLQCVLALVVWYVGVVHSWDFAVSVGDQLIFYNNDGNKTETVHFQSRNLTELAYDEVHNVMLYIDKQDNNDAICGYYMSSKENKCFIERNGRNINSIAYDPASEKIFFTDTNDKSINWISLKRESNGNIYGNLFIKVQDRTPIDISVDSCRGYIYWSNGNNMERAHLNGSEREAIFLKYGNLNLFSLVIRPQIQKIYYIDGSGGHSYLNYADLDGKNEQSLRTIKTIGKKMTVSKDYIYWMTSSDSYTSVWRLLQNNTENPKEMSKFYTDNTLGIAVNYKIADQIKGIDDCDSLSTLIRTTTVAPNNSQRCDVSVCENYCLQGNCSVNNYGLPNCSCNAGYTGPRCEVYACHGYCLYGNCSLSDDGHPTCSCNAGYNGLRCEVSACDGYCSYNGDCSLNENSEPVCHCKEDYSGERCEISHCLNYCLQGNCSLSDDRYPTCSCDAGYSGERCEVSACHGYCLNNGDCSLNEEEEPMCQCVTNYEGSRCEVDINDTTPTFDSVKRNLTLADLLSTWRKPSSKMYLTVEV